jgi:hypothetical protein
VKELQDWGRAILGAGFQPVISRCAGTEQNRRLEAGATKPRKGHLLLLHSCDALFQVLVHFLGGTVADAAVAG